MTYLRVEESQTRISSWWRRCGWGTERGAGHTSSLAAAARPTAIMRRRKARGVTGRVGRSSPPPPVSSLLARIPSMRRRSEAEQRDWLMVTRSAGSGRPAVSSLPLSRYCRHARWKEETAMQERCFGWA